MSDENNPFFLMGAMLGEKSGEVTDLRRRIEELEAKLAAEQERCAKVAQRCADLADTNGDYLLICDVVAAIREGGE